MENNPFGLRAIGKYIPEKKIDNTPRAEAFAYSLTALRDKIGIEATSRKDAGMQPSDMCVLAYKDLLTRIDGDINLDTIDLVVVVTQHPDHFGLPHTSSIVHGKIGLPQACFAFDISLGCSGFVAALATVSGHLHASGGKRALLFTCDPYSDSIDNGDKNTSMIFGDAATVTLIEDGAPWRIGKFDFGTKSSTALSRDEDGVLRMDGRSVFNFCALNVPRSVKVCLEANQNSIEDIDEFVMHPGSKYIVDTLCKRLQITAPAVLPCASYGNTISSSIPIILYDLDPNLAKTVLVSGFGVGMSWATTILKTEQL